MWKCLYEGFCCRAKGGTDPYDISVYLVTVLKTAKSIVTVLEHVNKFPTPIGTNSNDVTEFRLPDFEQLFWFSQKPREDGQCIFPPPR